MSVRRDTKNRLTLHRNCHICGKTLVITADTPFVRQVTNVDGKKQKTCYFCSKSCKTASYKHLFDGKADERRKEREAKRDIQENNRRYYAAHAEKERERAKARYWSDRDAALADNRYQRVKRAIKKIGGEINDKTGSHAELLASTARIGTGTDGI